LRIPGSLSIVYRHRIKIKRNWYWIYRNRTTVPTISPYTDPRRFPTPSLTTPGRFSLPLEIRRSTENHPPLPSLCITTSLSPINQSSQSSLRFPAPYRPLFLFFSRRFWHRIHLLFATLTMFVRLSVCLPSCFRLFGPTISPQLPFHFLMSQKASPTLPRSHQHTMAARGQPNAASTPPTARHTLRCSTPSSTNSYPARMMKSLAMAWSQPCHVHFLSYVRNEPTNYSRRAQGSHCHSPTRQTFPTSPPSSLLCRKSSLHYSSPHAYALSHPRPHPSSWSLTYNYVLKHWTHIGRHLRSPLSLRRRVAFPFPFVPRIISSLHLFRFSVSVPNKLPSNPISQYYVLAMSSSPGLTRRRLHIFFRFTSPLPPSSFSHHFSLSRSALVPFLFYSRQGPPPSFHFHPFPRRTVLACLTCLLFCLLTL
jgi:hypothetical protein